jgi:capsular exopolysaccharide synthesis family protein
MSWFYDALKRVEEDNPANGQDRPSELIEDGRSFLGTLESIAAIGRAPAKADARGAVKQAQAEPTNEKPATMLPMQQNDSVAGILPLNVEAVNNGYRKITLPVREDSRLVFHSDQHGLAAEQYRLLRRNLIQDFAKPAVLMITSPGEGDGKTLTALNLASCLADSGAPTLLVELDIRRPTLRKLLGWEIEAPGIEDALAGKVPAYQSVCYVEDFSLHVAPVVQIPRDPSHLVNSKGTRDFIAGARERFRWIIVDSAPAVPAADVADLLSLTDGVLLVIRAQRTPKDLTKRAFELLGRRLHSIIFNGATIHSNPHYRYLSRYYHSPK